MLTLFAAMGCGGTSASTSASATPTPNAAITGENVSTPTAATTTGGQQAITVKASGFSKGGRLPEMLGWGAVLVNTSSTDDALDVSVAVNVLDAKGNVLATDSPKLTAIPAGETFYLGGAVVVAKNDKPKKLEVYADAGSWEAASLALPEASNVRVENQESWGTVVKGQVTNTLDATLRSYAMIGIVLFDQNGNVVGGGFSHPMVRLPSGRTVAFNGVNGPDCTPFSKVYRAAVSVENNTGEE